jgi:hypothetical protein
MKKKFNFATVLMFVLTTAILFAQLKVRAYGFSGGN